LFRKFNKDERKGDFVIIHLNPDIFHTINEIMGLAVRKSKGERMAERTALEIQALQLIVEGNSEIPFIPDFKGRLGYFLEYLSVKLIIEYTSVETENKPYFQPYHNFITWKQAEKIFHKLLESSFGFNLKKQLHKKLYDQFKKSFEKLIDFSPDKPFYENKRDLISKQNNKISAEDEGIYNP
jgi:hypothetical protein